MGAPAVVIMAPAMSLSMGARSQASRPRASVVRGRTMIDDEEILAGVMEAFELPPMEKAVPPSFREAHGLGAPQQYGIACRNVRAGIREAEALGAGPFLYAKVKLPNFTERGQRMYVAEAEIALGHVGDLQIELLGPGEGTTFYADALRDRDVALHHVGIYQGEAETIAQSLEAAGQPLAARGGITLGPLLRFDFRYFDTRPTLGHYLEILDFTYLGKRTLDLGPLLRWGARRSHSRGGAAP